VQKHQDALQRRAAADEDEVRAAALQFVRKISATKPSRANEEAFEIAVDEIAAIPGGCSASSDSAPPRERVASPA